MEGDSNIQIQVNRAEGAFGSAIVFWELDQTSVTNGDITPTFGSIIFVDGMRTQVSRKILYYYLIHSPNPQR